jgi:hypothetical protein
VVVLIVMGGAIVLFGAVLLFGARERASSPLVEVLGLDVGPASAALLLAVGVAMVGLGTYPLASPWHRDGASAEASTTEAPQVAKLSITVSTAPPPPVDG